MWDDIEIADDLVLSQDANLLDSWITEQSERFEKLHRQMKLITRLPVANLDNLADKLEDIDYHTAALSNILDLVVSSDYYFDDELMMTQEHSHDFDTVTEYSENKENSYRNRWPLVEALWFHMMMLVDPESIYYSSRIGKAAWSHDFTPTE